MWGFGGEVEEPGDPIDIMLEDVTDEVGECIVGECIGSTPGDGRVEVCICGMLWL